MHGTNIKKSIHYISIKITVSHDWQRVLTLQANVLSNSLALLQWCENLERVRTLKPWLMLTFKCSNIPVFFNSNKSPTRCNSFPVYYPDVYLQLNMFRSFSRPSSGAQWPQWQPLVLPSYRCDRRAVFVVGPVITGPTTNTAWLSPRYEGKTRGCHCGHWAPDDGRENARNMLSCK